jgi:hypothetical protein
VITSLASGSWLEDRQIGEESEKGDYFSWYRIIACDSPLLDEIGIDMEIAGKGAILVHRLSTWGSQEDLKVLIRDLVKLSALGRYLTLHVIICVDVVLSPSLAKDIAFIQSTPLGNTDCIVFLILWLLGLWRLLLPIKCITRVKDFPPTAPDRTSTHYAKFTGKPRSFFDSFLHSQLAMRFVTTRQEWEIGVHPEANLARFAWLHSIRYATTVSCSRAA